jgi:hypothetical protein
MRVSVRISSLTHQMFIAEKMFPNKTRAVKLKIFPLPPPPPAVLRFLRKQKQPHAVSSKLENVQHVLIKSCPGVSCPPPPPHFVLHVKVHSKSKTNQ